MLQFIKKTNAIFLLCALLLPQMMKAQNAAESVAKSTEMAIPTCPAYQLLDAGSTLVTQPNVVHDLKVDWSLRTYSISPNIAIELQPVWEMLYNRTQLTKYRKASPIMRTLSTLSLSVGSFQRDTANQLALAAKLTLWRQHDAIMDDNYYLGLEEEYLESRKMLDNQIKDLKVQFDTTKNNRIKRNLRIQIKGMETQATRLAPDQRQKLRDMRTEYQQEHWNTGSVEVAAGRIFNFQQLNIDSLNLTSNGYGAWVTGAYGVGKNWLFTGMGRYSDISSARFINAGTSIRYGSATANGFMEFLYTRQLPNETLMLENKEVYTIAYGGDFNVSGSVRLGFGLRTIYNDNMEFKKFIPVASINCLMR